MRLGFNFTLGETYGLVQRLIAEEHIDYCELLIDNFLTVPPLELAKSFSCPIGFHIMFSKFLENDRETLKDLARRLKVYIAALDPIYVSDHVTRFTHGGRHFVHLGEIDYFADYPAVRDKIAFWQDALGRPLLLENFPSVMKGGHAAPEFYERIRRDTGAGVLFDASNAICAEFNCNLPVSRWDDVVASSNHFHVAGYRLSIEEPFIRIDSHAEALAPDTLAYLTSRRALFDKPNATLTYERDDDIEYDAIVADLTVLRDIFSRTNTNVDDSLVTAD